MKKVIFRPITLFTLVGVVVSLIYAPKPGIQILNESSHVKDVIYNSTSLFLHIVFVGTFNFAMLGIIIEVINWLIKRKGIIS